MTTALIISTYNRPDALRLCLESALRQRRMPDEIIIGDDGSTDDTRRLIDEFRPRFPVPLIHVWHPDDGFRLAAIRNKSVAVTSCDYIIQIDGDIVMHPMFVADHIALARRGTYAKGSRVRLRPEITDRMCRTGRIERITPFSRGIMRDREKAVRIPWLGRLISHRYERHRYAQGCNMAFWRDDFEAVNGYDEAFVG